jgi:hypothetical protein
MDIVVERTILADNHMMQSINRSSVDNSMFYEWKRLQNKCERNKNSALSRKHRLALKTRGIVYIEPCKSSAHAAIDIIAWSLAPTPSFPLPHLSKYSNSHDDHVLRLPITAQRDDYWLSLIEFIEDLTFEFGYQSAAEVRQNSGLIY